MPEIFWRNVQVEVDFGDLDGYTSMDGWDMDYDSDDNDDDLEGMNLHGLALAGV